jgi:hypothetical protein
MLGGNKKIKGDKTSKSLQASGAYTMGHAPHPYVVDPTAAEAIKKEKIYSFWSGVWYTTVLSILLFWIPPFGQMIAGYVGGRKAGTPVKGFAAALVPMSIVLILFIFIKLNIMVDELGWVFGLPMEGADYLAANLPLVGSLISFSTDYIQTFVDTMGFNGSFIAPYILTVIFGYVGGILSLQQQREWKEEEQPVAQAISQPVIVQQPVVQEQQPVPPPQQAAPQQEEVPVVMGKKPDGWDIKKDKKKGKW